jgi:hypothetical protein
MTYFKYTIRLLIALVLSLAWTYTGFQIGDGIKYRADKDLKIAELEEKTAQHRAIEAIYNSDKMNLVVDAANNRAVRAEYRLQKVCKKTKC